MLRENKDQAFVAHFDHQVELLQDFTGTRQKLNKALHELEVNQDDSQQQGGGGGGGSPQAGAAEAGAAPRWRHLALRRRVPWRRATT